MPNVGVQDGLDLREFLTPWGGYSLTSRPYLTDRGGPCDVLPQQVPTARLHRPQGEIGNLRGKQRQLSRRLVMAPALAVEAEEQLGYDMDRNPLPHRNHGVQEFALTPFKRLALTCVRQLSVGNRMTPKRAFLQTIVKGRYHSGRRCVREGGR